MSIDEIYVSALIDIGYDRYAGIEVEELDVIEQRRHSEIRTEGLRLKLKEAANSIFKLFAASF